MSPSPRTDHVTPLEREVRRRLKLELLTDIPDQQTLKAAAQLGMLPEKYSVPGLNACMQDLISGRMNVADFPGQAAVKHLMQHPKYQVRALACEHPDTTIEQLRKLAKERSRLIKGHAEQALRDRGITLPAKIQPTAGSWRDAFLATSTITGLAGQLARQPDDEQVRHVWRIVDEQGWQSVEKHSQIHPDYLRLKDLQAAPALVKQVLSAHHFNMNNALWTHDIFQDFTDDTPLSHIMEVLASQHDLILEDPVKGAPLLQQWLDARLTPGWYKIWEDVTRARYYLAHVPAAKENLLGADDAVAVALINEDPSLLKHFSYRAAFLLRHEDMGEHVLQRLGTEQLVAAFLMV